MGYCSIQDLERALPKTLTIGSLTVASRQVFQQQGDVNTISSAAAEAHINFATQYVDGRLRTLYFCPLRRTKSFEVLLTQNVSAGGNLLYVEDAGPFLVGDLIRITNGATRENQFVTSTFETNPSQIGQVGIGALQNSYPATTTRIAKLNYPYPIPIVCARLAAASLIDRLFVTERAPDTPTGFGKNLRTLASNDLDAILAGALRLDGQEFNGRRFVRTQLFDTQKATSQLPPGQGKEV